MYVDMVGEVCRYVDEVIPDSPYRVTQEFLDEHDLELVVHGDDVGAAGFDDVEGPILEAGLLRLLDYQRHQRTFADIMSE